MIRCAECDSPNLDDNRFCALCGATLTSQPPSPPPPPIPPTTLVGSAPARRAGATEPFAIYEDARQLTVPLRRSFRFIHEPVTGRSSAQFVGRVNEIESLAERILFSEGGSFLVTGYRGVGKTSFVNQVIRKLEEALPWAEPFLGKTDVIDIYLNIARPVQPSEMMHHIIRRVHDRLVERGIYHQLDQDLRDALKLAYDRTSVNMARKLAESSERSFGINEASLGGEWLKAAMKVSWNSKRSRTNNYEVSYLGYDDKAAEHDVISLSRRLALGYLRSTTRLQRMWHTMRRSTPGRVGLKIVFVFDELDKLEEFTTKAKGDEGPPKPAIDEIIGSLKNLFTTSGLTFIFVAGKDLQERWLEDVGRGDSVYESVFAYDKYLPCLWSDVGTICDAFVDRSPALMAYPAQVFDAFKKYLTYRGRGIPRRIIRTFNEYVEWDGEQPSLRFGWKDIRRIRFFAGLQGLVDAHEATLFGETLEEVSGTQSDKRRLGVYYLIDWILRRGPAEFTLNDVLEASRRLSVKIALAEEIAPGVAEDIISVLLDADYIQQSQNFTHVVIGAATADAQKRYRVTRRRLVEMGGDADRGEIDALLGFPPDGAVGQRERLPSSIAGFRVLREIGRGGMGVVYEGIDERHGQRVAIKVLNESLLSSGDLAARFEREAKILKTLDHPNIVRLVDWGHQAARLYIAMEFLDGVTLEEIIKRRGRLPLEAAATVGGHVAGAVQYVHDKGFVRNDIKPNNIMITNTGRVCLLDFGISRPNKEGDTASELDTRSFVIIGTPQFMAPEQFGRTGVDERSDVYSLGVVLYRMLTGVYPFEGSDLPDLMRAHFERVPDAPSTHAPVSAAADAVVLQCLAKDPANRFQSMAALAAALTALATPQTPTDLAAMVKDVREVGKEIDEFDGMSTLAKQPIVIDAASGRRSSSSTRLTPLAAQVGAPSPPAASPQLRSPGPPPSPTPFSYSAGVSTPMKRFEPNVAGVERPNIALIAGEAANVVTRIGDPVAALHLEMKTTVGRNSENDLVLRDPSVSRYHAVLDTADGAWFIEDANSGLGTYVNGDPVIDRRVLRDGDVITIGAFEFSFGASGDARATSRS